MEKTSSIRARDLPQQSKRNASWKDCPDLQLIEISSRRRKLSPATLKRFKEKFGLIHACDGSSASEKSQSGGHWNSPQSRSASEITASVSGSKRYRSLVDSQEMSSLLSMLRTEEFCGELDVERHSGYLGKQNVHQFLARRRASHFLGIASDSAIPHVQASSGEEDSCRSTKKAKTSSQSASNPELSQKTTGSL